MSEGDDEWSTSERGGGRDWGRKSYYPDTCGKRTGSREDMRRVLQALREWGCHNISIVLYITASRGAPVGEGLGGGRWGLGQGRDLRLYSTPPLCHKEREKKSEFILQYIFKKQTCKTWGVILAVFRAKVFFISSKGKQKDGGGGAIFWSCKLRDFGNSKSFFMLHISFL